MEAVTICLLLDLMLLLEIVDFCKVVQRHILLFTTRDDIVVLQIQNLSNV